MKVKILEPFGYCAGVERAINIALETKKKYSERPVVVLGMLVHNQDALEFLQKTKIETIYDPKKSLLELVDEIPEQAVVILTAHGHSQELEDKLHEKNIFFVDATCPFVTATFDKIKKVIHEGRDVLYLGKKNHPEANAALSINHHVYLIEPEQVVLHRKYNKPLLINQTTFSEEEVKEATSSIKGKVKGVEVEPSVCHASTMRQKALRELPQDYELIYVVGGANSNNTKTLFEIAQNSHPKAKIIRIKNVDDINKKDLNGLSHIAISSGASTPKEITLAIKDYLESLLD